MSELPPQHSEQDFESKKNHYFARLGIQARDELKLHEAQGLWDRVPGKDGTLQRDWGNVTEHCLVEIARTEVLAESVGLSPEMTTHLKTAAALHDFFKKGEKDIVTAEGLSWDAFEKASNESTRLLQEAGYSDTIVRLANSVGHGSLRETESILSKDVLTEEDTAYLILHYVDDYTTGSDWVAPATVGEDGNMTNALEQRMMKNEENPRYQRLNEEGKAHFKGETTYQAQRRIGKLVERKLAHMIQIKSGNPNTPEALPEVVDRQIREKINAVL